MSQLAHPDVAHVVEMLQSVGLRYRMLRVVRGILLFCAVATIVTLIAGMIAHWTGAGTGALLALIGWASVVGVAGVVWLVRPLVKSQKQKWVARLIEQRVDGLHNGLTNALMLADREDLQDSPFTPLIYSEIRARVSGASIDRAVNPKELWPVAWRCGAVVIVGAIVSLLLWPQLSHGWTQMFAPSAFVPQVNGITITSVLPGDTTLIKGRPLEVVVEISGAKPDEPPTEAQLFFEPMFEGKSHMSIPAVAPERFAARLEHVDEPMRYRVEVAGTQSRWFDLKVIDQIKLSALQLSITPPSYTKKPQQVLDVNLESITPVQVPMGSRVEVTAKIDTPVTSAMLQLSEDKPLEMQRGSDGKTFGVAFVVDKDTTLAMLFADATGQIVARLPEQAMAIQAQPDQMPQIAMRWPSQDVATPPATELIIRADLRDDFGLTNARVLMSTDPDKPLEIAGDTKLSGQPAFEMSQTLAIPEAMRKHGTVVRVQIEATDNRMISTESGPQTTQSPVYNITFRDPNEIAKESQERIDQLREALRRMLIRQQELHADTLALKAFNGTLNVIIRGQTELRDKMLSTAETFKFEPSDANVQKTLYMLARNPGQEAVDLATALSTEPSVAVQPTIHQDLQARQRRIIQTLESLLAMLVKTPDLKEVEAKRGGDLPTRADVANDLKAALEEFMKQQQKILDQTAPLAKKPVDDFSDADKRKLEELAMSQEKLDAFMQEKIADFSKLAEQDMANASLLKELMEVYSEVTMAKDALKKKETEIAVAAEEMGVELAKEITSNLEKWLVDEPDRIKWDQEDPLTKADIPMAELPKELEDMIGELMEEQEDILEEAEDTNANWTDSLDKGAGWDAADGPIANMSAKGVTGNQLPNNNEMGGRAGEGRSGKSQGEFVEETASGKGGRNTPTRLDPTPFQQGQIKDDSKDPVGGATGGGKLSGQGGEGLEGPVPPALKEQMQRLAQKQAQLRNSAERLNIKYQLGRYDNFKLLESIAIMRRVEADLDANRYRNAMRRKDVLLDAMDTSRMLVGGEIHVQHDTTPALSTRMEDQIHDAMKGDLPPGWSDALKTYYEKLGRQ